MFGPSELNQVVFAVLVVLTRVNPTPLDAQLVFKILIEVVICLSGMLSPAEVLLREMT